jgi:hypothetical protein
MVFCKIRPLEETVNSMEQKNQVLSSVSDPDWIRIQSGQWIRIRIRIRNPDPDPGGQKWPTKVDKK